MPDPCPGCGCSQADAQGMGVHAVLAALAVDDVDRAIEAGLLAPIHCPACTPECTATLLAARARLLNALAARERYQARNARLQSRAAERAARRMAPPPAQADARPPLPSAASAALARAKAKAAGRTRR